MTWTINQNQNRAVAEADARQVAVRLTAREYGELLAKLANELADYRAGEGDEDQATDELKMAFVKMDCACPYDKSEYFQTELMETYRSTLSDLYPVAEMLRRADLPPPV